MQYLRIITLENCSTLLEKEIFKGFALNYLFKLFLAIISPMM